MLSPPLLEAIAAHTQAVERGQVDCRLEQCPHCGRRPGLFSPHARRRRSFRVIIGRLVQPVVSALSRWKCLDCGKTFTLYPDFALPYKRYVCQDVCRLSGRYVLDDGASYHKAVAVHGLAVYYQAAGGGGIDERVLWPSTLHRWIGLLGGLKDTLARAWQLMAAKAPSGPLFRTPIAIPSWKYRSPQRKSLLQRCGRLLAAESVYRNLFQRSMFPYLATVCRWR